MTSTTRTYRHTDAEGKPLGWQTEVTADKFSTISRAATDEEIQAAIAAEDRAAKIAEFANGLDAPADDKGKKAK